MAIAVASTHELVESADETHSHIPLESLLEFEELAESRIIGDFGEGLSALGGRRRRGRGVAVVTLAVQGREADLREEALYLAQTLSDLGAIVGGKVVECEREKSLHRVRSLGMLGDIEVRESRREEIKI